MDELEALVEAIGEPVTIFYEPRNEGMEWMVSLTRDPLFHEHMPTLEEGLKWLRDKMGEYEHSTFRPGCT